MTCSKDFKTKYFSFIKFIVLCDVVCGFIIPFQLINNRHAQLKESLIGLQTHKHKA